MTINRAYEDLRQYILREPEAHVTGIWSKSPIKDILLEVLKLCPDIENVSIDQIREMILRYQNPDYNNYNSIRLGNSSVYINGRETRIENNWVRTSPSIEGVFVDQKLPQEEGLVELAESALLSEMKRIKYKGEPFCGVMIHESHSYSGVNHYYLRCPRPESAGFYNINLHIAHQTQMKFEEQIASAVKEMDLRYKARYRLKGDIIGSELWARDHIEGIPGIEYLGSHILSVSFEKDGVPKNIYSIAEFIVIDDNFRSKKIGISSYNDETMTKSIRKHQRNLKLSQEEKLKIDWIVAAAIRGADRAHQLRAIEEIKSLIAGKALNPVNPRKRGFSNFSVEKGIITAPVTLSKNVRFVKNKIHLRGYHEISRTLMEAMKGKSLVEVISHPWLPSVVIKNSGETGRGLNKCLTLSVESKHEILDDFLEDMI